MKSRIAVAGIYCIEHVQSGKKYIGKSVDIHRRLTAHRYDLNRETRSRSTNRHLFSAVALHGWNNFACRIIETLDNPTPELMVERELYWIDFYRTTDRDFGYNLRRDSELGMQLHPETRQFFAEHAVRVHTGRKRTEETRKRLSESLRGKLVGRKQTPEHIANRSAALKGRRGHQMSDAQREAVSAAAKRPKSEEHKRKISEAHKGKKVSDETRKRISEAARNRRPKNTESQFEVSSV